jgi:hypothetical protein
VEGVVVECGDVGWLPDLVFEAVLELVFENVAVRPIQKTFHFLLLELSDYSKIQPRKAVPYNGS